MKVKYIKYFLLEELVELGLSMNEVVFANVLVSFHKDDKVLRAGQENISEAMGVCGKTIGRIAIKLRDKGLISIVSGKAQLNANTYYPSTRLLGLYRQNVSINKDKKSNHTPKGYVKKDPVASLAKQHDLLKEYQSDLNAGLPLKDIKQRLEMRIKNKNK